MVKLMKSRHLLLYLITNTYVLITIIFPIIFSEIEVAFFMIVFYITLFLLGILWYIIGGKSIIRRNGITILTYDLCPELYDYILEWNKALKIKKRVEIGVLDDGLPNAFTLFNHPKKYTIVLSVGLFENLEKKEVIAVLFHELFHIYNKDIWIKASCIISRYLWIPFGVLLDSYFSRTREIQADLKSVQYTKDPLSLASALVKMVKCFMEHSESKFKVIDVSKSFWILNNSTKRQNKFRYTFFSRHPSLERRLQNLLQMKL
jgi:Zn-dependent protease with chaperone function